MFDVVSSIHIHTNLTLTCVPKWTAVVAHASDKCLLRCRAQVNPHKRLRQLYSSRMRAQYRGVLLGLALTQGVLIASAFNVRRVRRTARAVPRVTAAG